MQRVVVRSLVALRGVATLHNSNVGVIAYPGMVRRVNSNKLGF